MRSKLQERCISPLAFHAYHLSVDDKMKQQNLEICSWHLPAYSISIVAIDSSCQDEEMQPDQEAPSSQRAFLGTHRITTRGKLMT